MAAEERDVSSFDVLTSLSIAALSYCAANIVHEGLGHGLACRWMGGDFTGFGTSFSGCRNVFSSTEDAWFRAAGTGAGVVAGALTAMGLRLRPPRSPHVRYFAWLFSALVLVQGAGYLMIDSVMGVADWRFVRVHAGRGWQIGSILVGFVILLGSVRVLAPVIEPLLASPRRLRRAAVLGVLPWLVVGGGVMTAAALLSRHPGRAYLAMASFYFNVGCGALLPAWMLLSRSRSLGSVRPLGLRRRPGWILAGAAASLVVMTILGPGLTW